MSIIYLLCIVLIGLWIWSLIRSFHYHKIWHFIIQLLLGIFIFIPILSFIMKKSVNKKQNLYRQYIPPYTQQNLYRQYRTPYTQQKRQYRSPYTPSYIQQKIH